MRAPADRSPTSEGVKPVFIHWLRFHSDRRASTGDSVRGGAYSMVFVLCADKLLKEDFQALRKQDINLQRVPTTQVMCPR